uniref:NADH dehydrogenase [ubiquinone] iron-sulfur protein 5 n=1 Tax=Cebus imitator TaxID=2715852 RepID=A0A2K5PP61_CEBIM
MPFLDMQKRFGINLDHAEQPYKFPARCHAFEKWREREHGIGTIWAEKECKIEYDFIEYILQKKTIKCMDTIWRQREKLMKEGKCTPPPHHMGKGEPRP